MQHKPIVIIGGGPIGLTAALLLAKNGLTVTVLDAGSSNINDGRVLALSYASVDLLIELGAWPDEFATAINQVHISHSGFGVTKMLAQDVHLPELGYTVKYVDICAKLRQQVRLYQNIQLHQCIVNEIVPGHNYATIRYSEFQEQKYLTTDLAISAEGGRIQIQNISYEEYDYKQTAIITEIKTQEYHKNIAYEHFDNAGAMVLLPHAKSYTMVWSLPKTVAEEMLKHKTLAKHLEQLAFMKRFGHFTMSDRCYSFDLRLQVAKIHAKDHVVLIGNSAQMVHPVSAQGMNLGLRDARDLSNALMQDGLNTTIMAHFNQLRASDARHVVGFTHNLAKFMELNSQPLQHLRGLGIVALSNCKPLQNFIANSLIFGA